ncbi:glycosyltransferase family 4 protein [Dyadobacter fanqingshengii]|uniref:Glycosyltransferase family 4 protein n=1 Tax=Dyadobacter fanqingshengii TaxID=2906443 RepID=A0A9X1P6X7_9BACT|nr:glycosyltransferase family 4 protein [Dyadobacter fanqingshengii]MCF0039092.1 glycosyltransferase family 4 protein [Dyadobacter fanqingshengii]USJ34087.1 glycosyltransferase family 4 protein [Dyadobacter fanqingshengii]
MNKIKLLRITTETYSLRILLKGQLRYMSENGMDVYMSSTPDKHVADMEESQKARFYPLHLSRELTPFKDLIALYNTIRLIRKIKPQIVHTHSPKAGIIGMLAAYICNVPLKMHTVAGLPLMEVTGPKRKLLNFVESLTYWCADWVLPNSQELKQFILDNNLSSDKSKVSVLGNGSSNGIDLEYFSVNPSLLAESRDFREQHGIGEHDIVLAFMGRLANYKGVNELVKAFQILQQHHNNLKLILIGAPEDLNPLEEATDSEIVNNKSIIAVGHQNDVRKFLVSSNIFVFPSYREGFPQALLQASAMGIPCIATNINGCNEMIEDGKTGILIQPKSVQAIVEACEKLIENRQVSERMGMLAQQFVLRNFEQQQLWKAIHSFYNSKSTAQKR